MKKILNISLLASILLCGVGISFASDMIKEENILINDDRIFSLGNKYTSLISAMFEEETARLGLNGYHYEIGQRTSQKEVAKVKALNSLKATLENIKPSSLSVYAQADYYTLKELVNLKYFNTEIRKQFELDPMWYLEPIDTIYEMLIKDFIPDQERLGYALKRMEALPNVLRSAEENLTNPSDFIIQSAIDKVNLEISNLQGLKTLVLRIASDRITKSQLNQLSKNMETALKRYRNFLQKKLGNENQADFRLGSENYEYLFDEVYLSPTRYSRVEGLLEKNLNQAQKDLVKWMTPKVLVALPNDEKEQRTVKGKTPVYPKDYHLLAKNFKNAPDYNKVLNTYSEEVRKADEFFVTNKLFPTLSLPIVITSAPPTFRALPSKVNVFPPVALADKRIGDILVTMPKKLNLNKVEFNRDYNYGQLKFNSAEYITPGQALIYSVEPANLSLLCKLSDDMFYIHGWIKYAIDTAYENNFFDKEEDKLNYLWFNYKQAVYAVADYNLQTKYFDFDSALIYLKNAGIDEKEAKAYLNYLALRPFDAVSYIVGSQEFQRLRAKYKKQLKGDFNLATFHTKVLSVGRIPLIALEKTLEKAYAKKDIESYFNMTYF